MSMKIIHRGSPFTGGSDMQRLQRILKSSRGGVALNTDAMSFAPIVLSPLVSQTTKRDLMFSWVFAASPEAIVVTEAVSSTTTFLSWSVHLVGNGASQAFY